MKSAEAGFRFPVLGFTRDLEIWGFQDLDRLTKCGPRTLKDGIQVGMELVYADLRRWRVLSIRRTGRAGSLLSLLLPFGPPQSRIEQELEAMDALSIEDVRRRAGEAPGRMPRTISTAMGEKPISTRSLRKLRA